MFEIVEVDSQVEAEGLVELNGVDNIDVAHACEEPMQIAESVSVGKEETLSQITLCNEMLDCVAKSVMAHFKSQQVNEPELDVVQKRQIAKDVLNHSPAQFLSRFGLHVELKHLEYFSSLKQKDDVIALHLKELRRYHCESTKLIDVKNRRFEALQRMLKQGSYFSESEMKNRNPFLYEHLIGQYLTQREIKERDRAAVGYNSLTLVKVLLAQIDRDQTNELWQKQKDEEGGIEEMDTSDEESEEEEEIGTDNERGRSDRDENSDSDTERRREEMTARRKKMPTHAEKEMMKEEFYSFMYNSFLEGRDVDFDYRHIDFDSEFECLTLMAQDAEDKYFDAESPEEVVAGSSGEAFNGEELCVEDELDVYMDNLKAEPTPTELADQIENL